MVTKLQVFRRNCDLRRHSLTHNLNSLETQSQEDSQANLILQEEHSGISNNSPLPDFHDQSKMAFKYDHAIRFSAKESSMDCDADSFKNDSLLEFSNVQNIQHKNSDEQGKMVRLLAINFFFVER